MLKKIITKIKNIDIVEWTLIFSAVYLVSWFCNGFYNMKFSCTDLMTWYAAVIVKELGKHTIDSMYNSEKGQPPAEK